MVGPTLVVVVVVVVAHAHGPAALLPCCWGPGPRWRCPPLAALLLLALGALRLGDCPGLALAAVALLTLVLALAGGGGRGRSPGAGGGGADRGLSETVRL